MKIDKNNLIFKIYEEAYDNGEMMDEGSTV